MGDETGSGHDTRERLLAAACDVFAAKGFENATHREICDRAEANIAAINYYFGSKENLYAESWRKAFHDSLKVHPPDGGVAADAPAEERLRGWISAMIHNAADESNQSFRIAYREMANPTSLLHAVKRECVQPLQERIKDILRGLLGPEAPEKHVNFCQVSVAAQCFGVIRHIRRHRESGGPPPPSAEEVIHDIDGYAEHVFRFSLAGIRALRRSFAAGRRAQPDTATAKETTV